MQAKAETPQERQIQELRDENQLLKARLSLLSEASRRITSSLDLPAVLQGVVDAASTLIGAKYGALAVFDSDGHVQSFFTYGVSQEERERIGALPQGLGILGWLRRQEEPVRIADLSHHPMAVGVPSFHPVIRSFLGAPIRLDGQPLGNLYLGEKRTGGQFTQEDAELITFFVAQAAAALRNARLYAEVSELAATEGKLLAAAEADRRRLETLVNISPVGVFVAEAEGGRVVLVNREAKRILGGALQDSQNLEWYERAVLYRRPDGSLYEPQDLPLQRALYKGERVQAEEVRFELPDNHTVPTLVNAAPLYSPDGRISGAVAIIQDLTPVEELERLRSEFLALVSHELKTPLTTIKGSAATALGSQRDFSSQETRELFELIDEQADRLRDLVDNILDMTRIEAGSLSINPEPTDLRDVLETALASFSRYDSSHEVTLETPPALPPINGDRRRIAQVLMNLLTNAAKFSPETAPIALRVELREEMVVLHLQDKGRGIPQDRLPHLFKKFSSVHEEGSRRLAGTGLGLAIAKGIVEAHGGRILAQSPGPGQGSTFSFTLPLASGSALAAQGPDTTQRSQLLGRVHPSAQRTRVMVVDGEPQTLRLLRRTLGEAGYHVTAVTDPSQTQELVASEDPDLVLLGLRLPGNSGLDLLKQVREVSGIPVIFLTASSSSDDAVTALRAGADDYIAKPFSPSELLARIEATLRRRRLPDQLDALPVFALGPLAIDFSRRKVTVVGEEVKLTATEYKLLYELATHAGRIMTHGQILQRVWGPEYSGETELVRSFIRNLRRKLGDDAHSPAYILTERQVGYSMPSPRASAHALPFHSSFTPSP
ncbi:MAG: response regulator [Chloroflexi bacterium]|nr:response regulator [Chloroflexota bacterium]